MNLITLPKNTHQIPSLEIPRLIAEAITTKKPADTENITHVFKKVIPLQKPYDEEMAFNTYPTNMLTDAEWSYLNHICGLSGLAPLWVGNKLNNNITLSKWEQYQKAIELHEPDWVLFVRSHSNIQKVTEEHEKYLLEAIFSGRISVYDTNNRLPLDKPTSFNALKNSFMKLSVFKDYVNEFGINVVTEGSKLNVTTIDLSPTSSPPCLGKVNAINELAINIAWQMELKNNGVKTKPKLLIEQLKKMAQEKSNPILKECIAHGVVWQTSNSTHQDYDLGACRQTLSRWYKRRNKETNDSGT